jgi:hypothetical protein
MKHVQHGTRCTASVSLFGRRIESRDRHTPPRQHQMPPESRNMMGAPCRKQRRMSEVEFQLHDLLFLRFDRYPPTSACFQGGRV